MTAQTKQEELNSKVEVIKRLSLGKFHDNHDDGDLAINDAINGMRELINSEVLSAVDNVLNMLDAEIGMVDDDNAISGKRLRKNMQAHGESIKNRYKL